MIYMYGFAVGLGASLYARVKEDEQRQELTGSQEKPLIAYYGQTWPKGVAQTVTLWFNLPRTAKVPPK